MRAWTRLAAVVAVIVIGYGIAFYFLSLTLRRPSLRTRSGPALASSLIAVVALYSHSTPRRSWVSA